MLHGSPDPHYGGRAHSLSRTIPRSSNGYGGPPPPYDARGVGDGSPGVGGGPPEFTPLTPVSRIQIGGGGAPDRPLDRPTLVRPARTSLQHDQAQQQQLMQQQQGMTPHPCHAMAVIDQTVISGPYYPPGSGGGLDPSYRNNPRMASQPDLSSPAARQQQQQNLIAPFGSPRKQQHNPYAHRQQQQQPQVQQQAPAPEKEHFEVVPMNADKPCGLEMNDFLPNKFKGTDFLHTRNPTINPFTLILFMEISFSDFIPLDFNWFVTDCHCNF